VNSHWVEGTNIQSINVPNPQSASEKNRIACSGIYIPCSRTAGFQLKGEFARDVLAPETEWRTRLGTRAVLEPIGASPHFSASDARSDEAAVQELWRVENADQL
jgi:hypothetical protein